MEARDDGEGGKRGFPKGFYMGKRVSAFRAISMFHLAFRATISSQS
uniref:Uncharacterized protein n=1 Tax=Vitis vinifera TaxID=29760 RepID=F6GYD7_VITVI